MKKEHQFPYQEEELYTDLPDLFLHIKGTMVDYRPLPCETEQKGRGDCKDEAIWLYSRLLKKGFKDIRLVIGKYRSTDILFHAWVVWYHGSRVFILDPANQGTIRELKDFPSDYYRPYYSHYYTAKWRNHI
jgi:predicted transglutaminase-like cysteine proteinase